MKPLIQESEQGKRCARRGCVDALNGRHHVEADEPSYCYDVQAWVVNGHVYCNYGKGDPLPLPYIVVTV